MNTTELRAFVGGNAGQVAWPPKALTQLARMGLDINMVGSFDYRRYLQDGETYAKTALSAPELSWQMAQSNLAELQPFIPAFLEALAPEVQRVQLAHIDAMLADKRLVAVVIDGSILDSNSDFSMHTVLIYGRDDEHYQMHDPCNASRQTITAQDLERALGKGKLGSVAAIGFKLKDRHNMRLDQYVIGQHHELSRSYVRTLIENGQVTVNDQPSKPGYKLRQQDTVQVTYDASKIAEIPDIELPIIYEDADCLVINKPVGVLTHNVGTRDLEATVASFLRRRVAADPGGDSLRPGIVHRLDRLTSGVMICAKHPGALAWLQKQFHDRKAQKSYAAVITGQLDPADAVIDMPIERNPKAPATFRVGANGKAAVTTYHTVASAQGYSLLELQPRTGRTHQLRVHLANQGHPIVGDKLYNGAPAERLFLHAHSLELDLPNGEHHRFEAPIPTEFMTMAGLDKTDSSKATS